MKSRAAGILTAAMIGLAGCGEHAAPVARKTVVPVRTATVEAVSTADPMRYSAHIKPNQVLPLAFKYGGVLETIHQVPGIDGSTRLLQENDLVTKGTVLAQLRPKDFQLKVNQAKALVAEAESTLAAVRAQVAEAEAAQKQAKTESDRAQRLFDGKSLTSVDYQRAQTGLAMAVARVAAARGQAEAVQSRLRAAREQVDEAETALSDSALVAPIDGVVLKRLAEPGTLTAPGNPVFVLADMRVVKATMGIPDTSLGTIRLGSRLPLVTDAHPGETFIGTVSQIPAAADPKSHLFDVELSVPNPRRLLQAGMIATVRVTEPNTTTRLALPLSAVIPSPKSPNRYAVYLVESRGSEQVARMREVELGQAAGNTIAVLSGVSAGQRIVTNGSNLISDGEPLRVVQ